MTVQISAQPFHIVATPSSPSPVKRFMSQMLMNTSTMSMRLMAAPRFWLMEPLNWQLDDVAYHGVVRAAQLLRDVEGGHRGHEDHGDAGDYAGHGQGQYDPAEAPGALSQPRSCAASMSRGSSLADDGVERHYHVGQVVVYHAQHDAARVADERQGADAEAAARKLLMMPVSRSRATQARVRSRKLMHMGRVTSRYSTLCVLAAVWAMT